ncbi:hypothetical protein ACMFMG_010684 [Clarireedia jacksonii]
MTSKDEESEDYAGPAEAAEASVNSRPQHNDLSNIGILDFFDLDERPVIILDFENAERPSVAYTNPRLGELRLCEKDDGKSSYSQIHAENDFDSFLEWITRVSDNPQTTTLLYKGIKWTAQTLRNRWRVIIGIMIAEVREQIGVADEPPKKLGNFEKMPPTPKTEQYSLCTASQLHLEPHIHQRDTGILTPPTQEALLFKEKSEEKSEDKTPGPIMRDIFDPLTKSNLSPHICFFLDYDWAATELGPFSSWPGELRRMCNHVMVDPRPAALCCGTAKILIYNEAYTLLIGDRHPRIMGQSLFRAWEEHKDHHEWLFDQALASGSPALVDDSKTIIIREGYQEERYYSVSIIPFNIDSVPNRALYCSIIDTTRKIIAQRRMALLLRLGQELAISRNRQGFWNHLLRGLEPEDSDITYALLYSAGRDDQAALSTSVEYSNQPYEWILEGSLRVPNFDVNVPKNIRSGPEMDAFLSDFGELLNSESPTIISRNDGTIPYPLATAIGDELSSATAAFLPIRSTCTKIAGFLIIGLASQRRYDDDYLLFIQLLSRHLNSSMAAAVLVEDEVQRGRIAAEQAVRDRDRLSEALEIQAREAETIDLRFRRMADMAPVGMFHIDAIGRIVYANNFYYALTKQARDSDKPMLWRDAIVDDDGPVMDIEWACLMRGEFSSSELRLKERFMPDDSYGEEGLGEHRWILTAAYPEFHEDGTVAGVFGCLTDISKQKWTEAFQKRKMLEAIELKRQQENFIDMTSHEIRNPLSAIVQCADMIGTSIAEFGGEEDCDVLVPREIISSFADAASTIAFCAQHQKRIIDDILTLSKLDSDLFYITPVKVQPLDVVKNALKMFDGELQNNDISLEVHFDSSFNDLNVDWLKFDPSRMLQVLINLITNAIKFTHTEPTRKISITTSVSLKAPSSNSDIVYLERTNSRKQNTMENEWGDGEIVYLNIKVQDSGRGLDEHEQTLLFQKFSQASPRTHVQYGGSGLGLFISRELTELQGGQIGLASIAGEGSTFAFYILARRCNAPEVPTLAITKPESRGENQSNPVTRIHSPAPQASVNHRLQAPNEPLKALTISSPIHVLIVEDNIINQKVLTKQLLHVGCIVHVANHGLEALNFLEQSTVSNTLPPNTKGIRCDIILMDLEMPIMNGLTCIREIRMRERDGRIKRRVPVIALTANARMEQIEKAREVGVDSVVTKPFRIGELVTEMKKWVGVGDKRNRCAGECVGECVGGGSVSEDVRGRIRLALENKLERRQFDRRSTGPV